MPRNTPVPAILRRPGVGGIAAMAAISLALRAPITAVPPVAGELQASLGVSAAAIGLLTSIPVLCFGLITPVASGLVRMLGLRVSGVLCLTGVVIGSFLRSGGSFALAVVGTFLIGAGISIGNLVVPVLIGRVYPMRAATLMGGYSSTMNIGSTAATAATAALAIAYGWQLATASWGVLLGGVGLVVWLLFLPAVAVHAAPSPSPTPEAASFLDHGLTAASTPRRLRADPAQPRRLVAGRCLRRPGDELVRRDGLAAGGAPGRRRPLPGRSRPRRVRVSGRRDRRPDARTGLSRSRPASSPRQAAPGRGCAARRAQ